jgi:hypothetical protein
MFTNKKLILAAAIAAQSVLASNLLWFEDDTGEQSYDPSFEGDDADMTEAEREDDRRILKAKTRPEQKGFFRGNNANYKKQSREDKMEDLWSMLVPNGDSTGVEPNPYWYAKFPEFFTQKAQVTFCNNSDEIKRNRNKTMHTQGLVA